MAELQNQIDKTVVQTKCHSMVDRIFSLLPTREEEKDWQKPLEKIIVEIMGMASLFPEQDKLLTVACKLAGLHELGEEVDFLLYRRTIFEVCSLMNKIEEDFQ